MVAHKPKGVVLLSGGMDSCVSAAIANESHHLAALHVSYGQRSQHREQRAFEEIADFYGVHATERLHIHLDIFAKIGGSALVDTSIAVPEQAFGEGRNESTDGDIPHHIPVTYVPFRNAHFLSAAVSWAEVIGANAVFIGAVHEDSSGYPDCRPEYYQAFQEVVSRGTKPETKIEIITPVIGLRKSEIIQRGNQLGAPLNLTWSCYQYEDAACGVCDSCRLRLAAFAKAGMRDPIAYRSRVAP